MKSMLHPVRNLTRSHNFSKMSIIRQPNSSLSDLRHKRVFFDLQTNPKPIILSQMCVIRSRSRAHSKPRRVIGPGLPLRNVLSCHSLAVTTRHSSGTSSPFRPSLSLTRRQDASFIRDFLSFPSFPATPSPPRRVIRPGLHLLFVVPCHSLAAKSRHSSGTSSPFRRSIPLTRNHDASFVSDCV